MGRRGIREGKYLGDAGRRCAAVGEPEQFGELVTVGTYVQGVDADAAFLCRFLSGPHADIGAVVVYRCAGRFVGTAASVTPSKVAEGKGSSRGRKWSAPRARANCSACAEARAVTLRPRWCASSTVCAAAPPAAPVTSKLPRRCLYDFGQGAIGVGGW